MREVGEIEGEGEWALVKLGLRTAPETTFTVGWETTGKAGPMGPEGRCTTSKREWRIDPPSRSFFTRAHVPEACASNSCLFGSILRWVILANAWLVTSYSGYGRLGLGTRTP